MYMENPPNYTKMGYSMVYFKSYMSNQIEGKLVLL